MNEQEPTGEIPDDIEKERLLTAKDAIDICLKAIEERSDFFSHLSSEDLENLIESLKDIADDDFDLDLTMGNIVGLLTDAQLEDPIGFLIEIDIYQ